MRNPIIPIVLAILAVATYFAFITPWWAEVNSLKADIKVAEGAITKGNELKELVQNITEKVGAVSPDNQSRLQAILPTQIDDILFLNDINALAGNRGLQAKNLSLSADTSMVSAAIPDPEVGGATKGSQTRMAVPQKEKMVSFSVTAKYPAFISFLRDLERSLVLYETKSITFSEKGEGNAVAATVKNTTGKGEAVAPEGDDYSVKFTTYSVE